MPDMGRSIDEIIRNAIEEGKFDNLAGSGRPLNLNDNPFVDREWQMAFKMLEEQGFGLPWMEKRQEIEQGLGRAREKLARTWHWHQKQIQGEKANLFLAQQEWKKAVRLFEETCAKLNRQIDDYNLEVPGSNLQRRRIDPAGEVAEITGSKPV